MIYFLNVVLNILEKSDSRFKTISKDFVRYIVRNGIRCNFGFGEKKASRIRHALLEWFYYKARMQSYTVLPENHITKKRITLGAVAILVPALVLYRPKL